MEPVPPCRLIFGCWDLTDLLGKLLYSSEDSKLICSRLLRPFAVENPVLHEVASHVPKFGASLRVDNNTLKSIVEHRDRNSRMPIRITLLFHDFVEQSHGQLRQGIEKGNQFTTKGSSQPRGLQSGPEYLSLPAPFAPLSSEPGQGTHGLPSEL